MDKDIIVPEGMSTTDPLELTQEEISEKALKNNLNAEDRIQEGDVINANEVTIDALTNNRKPFTINQYAIFINTMYAGAGTMQIVYLLSSSKEKININNQVKEEEVWKVRTFDGNTATVLRLHLFHLDEQELINKCIMDVLRVHVSELKMNATISWCEWYQKNEVFKLMRPYLYDEQIMADSMNKPIEFVNELLDKIENGDLTGIKPKPELGNIINPNNVSKEDLNKQMKKPVFK